MRTRTAHAMRMCSVAGVGVLAALAVPDVRALYRLHLITRALAPESSTSAVRALDDVEQAARGCGVFVARRHDVGEAGAIQIVIDESPWYVCPDPSNDAWIAMPAALSGDGPEPDAAFYWLLKPTDAESAVPTRAWAAFLDANPRR